MSAVPPTTEPPLDPTAPAAPATLVLPDMGTSSAWGILALVPLLMLLAFHVGAGYLSYQKYGNLAWAFLDFIFAYFYYPYYAFFLAKDPGPSAQMFGGKRGGLVKMLGKLLK